MIGCSFWKFIQSIQPLHLLQFHVKFLSTVTHLFEVFRGMQHHKCWCDTIVIIVNKCTTKNFQTNWNLKNFWNWMFCIKYIIYRPYSLKHRVLVWMRPWRLCASNSLNVITCTTISTRKYLSEFRLNQVEFPICVKYCWAKYSCKGGAFLQLYTSRRNTFLPSWTVFHS